MRVLWSCLLLFVLSLSLDAAGKVELRAFPDERINFVEKMEMRHIVQLPADAMLAEKMLFSWNAGVATAYNVAPFLIPRLDQLYGEDADGTKNSARWIARQDSDEYYSKHKCLEIDLGDFI